MAYSELQAERLRAAIGQRDGVVTRRMMGSLVFMLDNNMLAGTRKTSDGGDRFMLRVRPERMAEALIRPGCTPAVMGGRTMKGFVFVADCDDTVLTSWVRLALDFVESLPAK